MRNKKNAQKILLLVKFHDSLPISIKQSIYYYRYYSLYSVDVVNMAYGFGRISKSKLSKYVAVIVHNSTCYNIDALARIKKNILDHFQGITVIMKQDEHFNTNKFIDFLDHNKIDLLLSIWNYESAVTIYKNNGRNQQLNLMSYLTGYVAKEYKSYRIDGYDRAIDIGYRGSMQPLLFGKLAYEKYQIGEAFIPYAHKFNLKYDISSRAKNRFYGDDWIKFLRNCKAVLGVESGSNIVDFDGTIYESYNSFIKNNPNASEAEIVQFVDQFEGDIQYRAISPRHFEAIACGALQILYEGEYQGILKPYRHYVPLKRDFSNIDEVVDYILDVEKRQAITLTAFNEIILNPEYSYEQFSFYLDSAISKIYNSRKNLFF